MEQNVIQMNGEITINVHVSVRNIIYEKKNMFGILVHVFMNLVITSDEVIESYDEEMKTIPTNFNEENVACKVQNLYNLLVFLLPLHY